MDKQEYIEIQINKKKIMLFIMGTMLFVIAGLFMIFGSPKLKILKKILHFLGIDSPATLQIVSIMIGIIGIVFFGLGAIFFIKRLLDKKAGFIINEEGITDNSSFFMLGFISWKEIVDVQITNQGTCIFVDNPNSYIDKEQNPIIRKLMQWNNKSNGSVMTTSPLLEISQRDLCELLQNRLQKYKASE